MIVVEMRETPEGWQIRGTGDNIELVKDCDSLPSIPEMMSFGYHIGILDAQKELP